MGPLLLLLACSPDGGPDSGTSGMDTGGGDTIVDPSAPGAWAVGTDETRITGSWGVELSVQTWFPRADDPRTDGQGAAAVYDDMVTDPAAFSGGMADCSSPRPVVVFSHGNQGVRWQSFYLADHLASHGVVVVAPDHAGNTFFDYDGDRMPELVFRRPVDVADAFDALVARGADATDPLYGCVDPDGGYAVMGHSFGGYTTLAVAGAVIDVDAVAAVCAAEGGWLCDDVATWAAEHPDEAVFDQSDPRARVAVALAPAGYEVLNAGLGDIAIPTMIQAGDLDATTPWETTVGPIWEALQVDPRAAAHLDGAGHYSFSDVCSFLPTVPDCDPPYRDPEEVHDLSRTLALAWMRWADGDETMAAWLPPPGDERLSGWETGESPGVQ